MPGARSLLRNVGSNGLGYVVNVVVSLLLTPYVVERLDKAGAGLWSLIVSFVGYYGLLDVGVRSAVGHYVATYHAQRDEPRVNRTLSTAMAVMLGVAAIAGVVTWFAGERLPDWYRWVTELRAAEATRPAEVEPLAIAPEELRVAIWIMGAGFALSFPMALYGTVLYSVQRLALQNAIGIGQTLVRAALTWMVLERGWGIVGLACVAIGCNVLGWVASIVAAYRVLPSLSLGFARVSRASLKELYSYGGFNVLVNVGDTVLLYTAGIVIMEALHDAVAVNYYAIPATSLIPYFMQLVQAVTWSFTPHFTGRWAVGRIDDVRRLFSDGTRWVTLLAAVVAGGLLFLGQEFLAVWMGPDWVGGELFPTATLVLSILAVATLVRASQSTGRQALFAMREVRWLGFVVLIEAAINVALSVVLVRTHGLAGVAVATLIPVVLMQGLVQPRHLLRELELDAGRFAFDVARAALPPILAMGAVDALVAAAIPVDSWPSFVLRGVVVTAPAVAAGLLCSTTAAEREALWSRLRPRRGGA